MISPAKPAKVKAKMASRPYFAALDGFRGLFAILIAVHHTNWFSYLNYRTFIDDAFFMLDMFFAFSGFLMFTLYRNHLSGSAQAKSFIGKRFARLYPLHLFTFGLFFAFAVFRLWAHKVGLATHEPGEVLPFSPEAADNWWSAFTNLTLTHSMGLNDSLSFNAPSWTISVEFFAYFVFAGMMLWAPPKKLWHFGLMALGVAGAYAALYNLKPNMDITYDYGFLRCLGGFFTGVLGAWAFAKVKAHQEASPKPMTLKTASALEVTYLVVCSVFIYFSGGILQFFAAPLIFGFVVLFALDGGYISKFMGLPVFRYLAKISYSVYMNHFFLAIIFGVVGTRLFPGIVSGGDGAGLAGDLYLIPYLAVVIVMSHLTYHYIEVPGGKWIGNRLKARKTSVQNAART
ncbi:acyltransferase family protein [Litorimonas haliclonae]|uniref:acyltransferase family protein n=1 Tax=Litorimonas haliclonae TaxID=2081977 RepID=UPI0039EF69C5